MMNFVTFTLVKSIGIAFFLRSHFFGFIQCFRDFGHAFVYNRYMIWGIPNIYRGYLLGKFGTKV